MKVTPCETCEHRAHPVSPGDWCRIHKVKLKPACVHHSDKAERFKAQRVELFRARAKPSERKEPQ